MFMLTTLNFTSQLNLMIQKHNLLCLDYNLLSGSSNFESLITGVRFRCRIRLISQALLIILLLNIFIET